VAISRSGRAAASDVADQNDEVNRFALSQGLHANVRIGGRGLGPDEVDAVPLTLAKFDPRLHRWAQVVGANHDGVDRRERSAGRQNQRE
jgi:hypothetical protein